MRMNTGIPLAVQQPDIPNALAAGARSGMLARAAQDQNQLRQLYAQQGPGIMQGDPAAMNALAQLNPEAAFGMNQQRAEMDMGRQRMEISREQLDLARQAGAREAQRLAAAMDAETAAREHAETLRDLRIASEAYTRGPEAFAGVAGQLGMEGVTYETFPMAAAAAEGGLEVLYAARERSRPDMSAPEMRIGRIMESYGVDRRTATGIVDGVVTVSRDPITGEAIIIDKISGQPVNAQQAAPAQTAAPQAPQAPQSQAAPTAAQAPELSFGEPYSDAENAFGMEGALRRGVNTISDAAGFGPAFPETLQTQRDFAVLKEKLINDIASSYERQPPSWLLRNIEDLTPESGRPFQGAGDAVAKLTSIGRDLEQEREAADRALRMRRMSPGEREAAEARRASLDAAIQRVATALAAFGTEGEGRNRTSSGVSWSVEE